MNFVSFVLVSFFFLCMRKNKQSILEAAHRDNEMVIEAFPIWGGGRVQYSGI